MDAFLFGLPFQTVAVVLGVPGMIIAFLVWWGLSFQASDQAESRRVIPIPGEGAENDA
jgi:hypothetical protein